ncbi:MAG: transcriptional regulator, TraR/DksA family protein, partial [Clostridiaceae bacterium]|nr:transcriptional regulator, TraR/DksA family protein [Clostridiaceae bacterium]
AELKEAYGRLSRLSLEERQDILNDMMSDEPAGYRVTSDSELSRYDNHTADIATELYDASHLDAIRDSHKIAIKEIDYALEKIKNNKYGICETCGEEIGEERLEVVPRTRNCINCETLAEKENKLDKISKSTHRPVEEDVLEKVMRGDFTDRIEEEEPYDGRQALEEVLSFGSSDSPQDGAPSGNRQDAFAAGRGFTDVQNVEDISNEMYERQLT